MKQEKRFLKSNIRRLLSLLLVMTLLLPPATIVSFAADNDIVDVEVMYTGTLMENMDGYWNTNSETGEEYFCYNLLDEFIEVHVTYNNGQSCVLGSSETIYEIGEQFYSWCNIDSVWEIGTHQATWECGNFSGTVDVEVIKNPIQSVDVQYSGQLIENVDGYWRDTDNNEGEWFEYYLDDAGLEVTITYDDGSVFTGDGFEVYIETGHSVWTFCNDEADVAWDVGMHQVYWECMNFSGTFDVEVVAGPIESVSINYTEVLYEGIDGSWTTNWDTGEEYFQYDLDPWAMDITVKYKDGTVYTGDQYDIEWGTDIYFTLDDGQSAAAPWSVGKHTVDFHFSNYTGSFEVEVVENPVQAVDVNCTKQFRELYDGEWDTDYDGDTGEVFDFFDYMPSKSDLEVTVTYKDGTTSTGSAYDAEEKTGMLFSVDWNNSYNDSWKVGDNTAEFTFAGISGTFNVKVLESPVSSIEIGKVRTFRENEGMGYLYTSAGTSYYGYKYDFTYRLHFKDGTSQLFNSNNADRNVKITDTQATEPWNVDGKNEFIITCGGVSATGSVKILPTEDAESDFDFIAQDGGIVITGYNGSSANLEIPSEINGQSVIGIQSLGGNDAVTDVTVPDSVKFLGNQWAKNLGNIETVHLGKNVSNFDPDMFFEGYDESEPSIKSVTVSGENPYFMDIDGVVYTKDGTTLVFYPYGHGNNYTVPDGVTNIDLLFDSNYSYNYRDVNVIANTENFISEAGVLYTKGKQKILKCSTDKAGQYIMPESVTEILAHAFADCTKLTSIQVSSNVTKIPDSAFYGCSSLKTVIMPSVVSVGQSAFNRCSKLTEISSKPLTSLGEYCFEYCESLTSVVLGEGLQCIPYGAFNGCSAMTSIDIPSSVTTVERAVISGCSSLKEITIPSSVTEMDAAFTFEDCTALESVTIDSNIQELGEAIFKGCTSLKNIELPSSILAIDSSVGLEDTAYYKDQSNWDNDVLYIDNYLIGADADITGNYTIEPGTKVIAGGAFENCKDLAGVTIPGSVVSIGYGAFKNCSKLASVSLSDGITSISDFAFAGCESLKEIDIPNTVTNLDGYVFDGCTALTNVKMSSAIKELDYRVFADCPNLKLDFLDGIETIGWRSFSGSALTTDTLVIPDSVTSIVYDAFEGNTSISNIEVPDHFVSIQQGAFDDTAWYTSQSDDPLYLGSLLYTCKGSSEQSVEVVSDTKWIASGAFEDQPLENISLPEGLQQIGENAFLNCFMDEIYIPESVTEIQERALGYYGFNSVDGYFTIPGFTIYGYAGTEAERYANDNGFKFVALSKPTDTATGISVVPAYTDSSLPENTVLTVETLSSSPTRVCYDISLTADGQAVQPDGAVAVKIPVPAGMDGAACKVYRAETDGTYTDMNAAYADGYLTFTTDHFSEYVVTTGDPADVPSADLLGDVDGNGMVNAADAVMVLRSDAGLVTLTAEQAAAADVTGDGIINASDAVQILRYDAGLITAF